ncbi:MAG: hypothetical protein AB1586_16670 [Pseudomonadota bacterium]
MNRDDDTDAGEFRFYLRLLIKHPTIDPKLITKELGLSPHLAHVVGTERITPMGTKLSGRYEESTWGWAKRVQGRRAFLDDVSDLALQLQKSQHFIASLIAGGGNVTMIVDLPGDVNIGSVLSSVGLKRLADLGIDLGIEVFPELSIDG